MIPANEHVMVLVVDPGSSAPRPVEGRLVGEDRAGILVQPDGVETRVLEYIPYVHVETVLLLGQRSEADQRKAEFEQKVHHQRVLDELDRIFFDMVDRKGRYSRDDPVQPLDDDD